LVGDKVLLYSGKEIRSKQRYSNKIKADFSAKLSKLKKHSRKYKKLNKKKRKILNKIKNQIRDIEHKQTTHFHNNKCPYRHCRFFIISYDIVSTS